MKKIAISSVLLAGAGASLYVMAVLFARYGTCAYLSEDEVMEFTRKQIANEIDYFVRHFGVPAKEVQAGRFVLFSDWGWNGHFRFSVMYQGPRGRLVEFEIGSACNVDWYYPDRIRPLENAIFVRDLRTGQPYIETSMVTGTSSVPGTEASHSGAIQLPGGAIRP